MTKTAQSPPTTHRLVHLSNQPKRLAAKAASSTPALWKCPLFKFLHVFRLHLPNNVVSVANGEAQRGISEEDGELEIRFAVFFPGGGVLEAFLPPELGAFDGVMDRAERSNRCQDEDQQVFNSTLANLVGLPAVLRVGGVASWL